MVRLYEQHSVRTQRELDGVWEFVTGDGRKYTLPVPGCWEQQPELVNYRGTGTYSKKIVVRKKTNLRLEFKGVSHTADLFMDGEFLAHHYNAYTGFCAIARDVAPGEHEIRVQVDNSFSEASALHIPNDYYTYGGITRPVVMEELLDVYIRNVHFTPYKKAQIWFGKTEVWIENLKPEPKKLFFTAEMLGEKMTFEVNVDGNEIRKIEFEESYEAEDWEPERPRLYLLNLQLSDGQTVVDDLVERVGFRTVEVSGNKIRLNGKDVFLKGFNRHEEYGDVGCAVPFQFMVQDMDLMQEAGANAVRTCHYPNDERFLDLCDERGIMVWEENHARGLDLERMCNPNFDRQCADCIEEMIAQHYNHPSIVIWGILNECASETKEGREKYKMQYEQIKRLDATRPTTSATCRHFTDICLDLPDVVSFNIYSGWYQDVSVKERHEQEIEWIGSTGGAGKPLIISEFGAAAIYGCRDRGHCKWSEERQADIIRENLEVYRGDDRLSGVFIWQFADCRVTEEWFSTRARCHNNKGVVDEYRRPKESFYLVKEMFPGM